MSAVVVTGGTVRPGGGHDPVPDGAVLVEGEVITAVGPRAGVERRAGPDATRIVLPAGTTVLPGLVDGAARLSLSGSATTYDDLPADRRDGTLDRRVAGNAMRALRAGVTTIRDVGEADHAVLRYRDRLAHGGGTGPRVLCSGAPLTIPDGDASLLGGAVADDDGIRAAVAERAAAGAEFVTYHDSGGYFPGRWRLEGWRTHFTAEQCRLIVDEAHRHGLRAASHTFAADGARHAVAAGADVIDQLVWNAGGGNYDRDPAAAERMAERGIVACMPSGANRRSMIAEHGEQVAYERWYSRYTWLDGLGVRLLPGSNAGVTTSPFGDYVSALETYDWLGFGGRTLELATSGAADALGLAGVTGTLAPGLAADLLVVDGDPVADLQALRAVRLVMARGMLVT